MILEKRSSEIKPRPSARFSHLKNKNPIPLYSKIFLYLLLEQSKQNDDL